MNYSAKYLKVGLLNSWILLILTIIFLIIILVMGKDIPAFWGMTSAFEKSHRCFVLYRVSIVVAFFCLPAWAIIMLCFNQTKQKSGTAWIAFFLSLLTFICIGIAYVTELFYIAPSVAQGNLPNEIKYTLHEIDNNMFLFDNIGYFFMGMSSLLAISDTVRNQNWPYILPGLCLFGIASVLGLTGVWFESKFLMTINVIGMTLTYPLAACSFIIYFKNQISTKKIKIINAFN